MDGVAKTDDHAAKVVAHRKEHEKHEAYKAERMERQSGEGPHRAHCTSRTHVASWLRGLSTPAHSMRMLPCWRSMTLAQLHENQIIAHLHRIATQTVLSTRGPRRRERARETGALTRCVTRQPVAAQQHRHLLCERVRVQTLGAQRRLWRSVCGAASPRHLVRLLPSAMRCPLHHDRMMCKTHNGGAASGSRALRRRQNYVATCHTS